MEERKYSQTDIMIQTLKALPLTVESEYEDGVYCMQAKEFPYAIEYSRSKEKCQSKLVKSLKEWALNLAGDFDNWKAGHESEIPYIFKLLLSDEREITECLRYEK